MMNHEPLLSASTLATGAFTFLCVVAVAAFFLYHYLTQWIADDIEKDFETPRAGRSRY